MKSFKQHALEENFKLPAWLSIPVCGAQLMSFITGKSTSELVKLYPDLMSQQSSESLLGIIGTGGYGLLPGSITTITWEGISEIPKREGFKVEVLFPLTTPENMAQAPKVMFNKTMWDLRDESRHTSDKFIITTLNPPHGVGIANGRVKNTISILGVSIEDITAFSRVNYALRLSK